MQTSSKRWAMAAIPALLAVAAGPALAQAPCVPGAPPKVTVEGNVPRVAVDNSLDKWSLGRLREKLGGKASGPNATTMGLTRTTLNPDVEWNYQKWRLPDGTLCGALREARFRFNYQDPILVYIMRDHPPGTCRYDAIHKHEMTHVRFVFDVLAKHLPVLREKLPAALAPLTAVREATDQALNARMKAALEGAARSMADAITRDTDALHATIDTEESYRAESALCR